jgi:hypothetical protein
VNTTIAEQAPVAAERNRPSGLGLPADASPTDVSRGVPAPVGQRRGRRAAGAVALAIGVLVAGTLLSRTPEAPPAAPAATPLPPMPASTGLWDRLAAPAPVPALPELPTDVNTLRP